MAISHLHVAGYRSIRDLQLPLQQVNVLVGPNACGKSNLYNSIHLMAAAAAGTLARTLADEGGTPSVLWAGARRKGPVRLVLGVTTDLLEYEIQCGLPQLTDWSPDPEMPMVTAPSCFSLDPEVKEECVHVVPEQSASAARAKVALLERHHTLVRARDDEGRWTSYPFAVVQEESVLSQLREPHMYPELSALRQQILGWRFYHQFRTDAASPLRQPQVGIRTPVLGRDGVDVAAALQTIREVGDRAGLDEAVDSAFPGARLDIRVEEARFLVLLQMPGFTRPFDARELSDGTLQYLCLLAALMSPRPPDLMALNEPESSIHPDLLPALARLIVNASRHSQMWITTHSSLLASELERLVGTPPVVLEKVDGETRLQKDATLGRRVVTRGKR